MPSTLKFIQPFLDFPIDLVDLVNLLGRRLHWLAAFVLGRSVVNDLYFNVRLFAGFSGGNDRGGSLIPGVHNLFLGCLFCLRQIVIDLFKRSYKFFFRHFFLLITHGCNREDRQQPPPPCRR